jgi:hypothetical protein
LSSLLDLLNAIYESKEVAGVSYAGTVNIESGTVQVGDRFFGPCDCGEKGGPVSDCSQCGRTPGNHVRLLSGKGDGAYAGINFWSATALLATIYLLDEDNSFAAMCREEIDHDGDEWQVLLATASEGYWGLPCALVAQISPETDNFVRVGDHNAGRNSEFAVVEQWRSGGGQYSVFVACEHVLASPSVQLSLALGATPEQFTAGFIESQRPRAIVVAGREFSSSWSTDASLGSHDWRRQSAAWREMLVDSSVAGSNNLVAMFSNGLYWRNSQARQFATVGAVDDMWFNYAFAAFGWFVTGAYLGSADCAELMVEMISDSNGELALVEQLETALETRGWDVTVDLVRFVESATLRK